LGATAAAVAVLRGSLQTIGGSSVLVVTVVAGVSLLAGLVVGVDTGAAVGVATGVGAGALLHLLLLLLHRSRREPRRFYAGDVQLLWCSFQLGVGATCYSIAACNHR
jgi:hypothetical protein